MTMDSCWSTSLCTLHTHCRMAFEEKPYSSAALNGTYENAIRKGGVNSGHTSHSTKRGSLQATSTASHGRLLVVHARILQQLRHFLACSLLSLQAPPLGAVGGVPTVDTRLPHGLLVSTVQRCA